MYQQISQKLVKSARGVSKECSICDKKFELFLREHICKRCLRPVCSDCSPKKLIIADYDLKPKEKHRVCINCKNESKFQKTLRKESSLEFGKISQVSLKWLQSLNLLTTTESFSEIQDLEEAYNKARTKELIQNIDVTKMKKHLSYSFRQYAHQVQKKETPDSEVAKQLVNLLNKLAYRFDWKTLPNKFHLITYFFLTVASEPLAFHLLVEIYTNYIPNYAIEFMNDPPTSSDKSLTQNQKVKIQKMLNYLIGQYKYEDVEQKQVQSFIQFLGLELVSSLYVDMLSVECFFTAIDDMITKNTFMEIERVFIMLIRYHHEFIKKCSPSQKEQTQTIMLYLIRNTSIQVLKEKCKGEKTFENRSDSFEYKTFKQTSSQINIENKPNEILSDSEVKNSLQQKEINQREKQPPQVFTTQESMEIRTPKSERQEKEVSSQFPPPPQNGHTNQSNVPIMNPERQMSYQNGNVTESDTSSQDGDNKEEVEEYNVKQSIQYAPFENMLNQNNHLDEEEEEKPQEQVRQSENLNQKSDDVQKSEISFFQRQIALKEKELQERNEEIKRLQNELKTIQRENNNVDEFKNEINSKNIEIERLIKALAESQERYTQLENQQKESAQHPHNNILLDKLWKELQAMQRKQEEMREEKVQIEQDLLAKKEEILVNHLREITLLKSEVEEYQKQIVQNEEKRTADITEHTKKVLNLEQVIQEKDSKISNQQSEITSLNIQIHALKENESVLKKEIASKTEQSLYYSNSVETQLKELQANLESMRASNTSLIQEHKTLMDLTTKNNNLVFEELKIQISEQEETIKTQKIQIQEGQVREANLAKLVEDQVQEILELKAEVERLRKLVQEQEESIKEKDEKIQNLDQRVLENQTKIGELEFQVKQKDEIIDDLRNQIMQKDAEYKTDMELMTNNYKEEQQKRKDAEKHLEETSENLAQTKSSLEQSEEKVNSQETQIKELQAAVSQLETEKSTLQSELEEAKKVNEEKTATIAERDQEIAELKKKLENRCEDHDKIIAKLKADLNRVQSELNKYLSIFQSVKQTVTNVKDEEVNEEEEE